MSQNKLPKIDEVRQAFTDIFWLKSEKKNLTMWVTIPEKDIAVFLDNPPKYLFEPLNTTNEDSIKSCD